jgi:hypothetical protein
MRTWKSLTGWRLCRPCLLLTKTPYDGVAKMHQATSRDKHEGAVAPPQDARLEFMDLQFGNKKPQRQAYTVYIQYGKTLGLGGGMLVVMCSKDWESRSASLLLSAPPSPYLPHSIKIRSQHHQYIRPRRHHALMQASTVLLDWLAKRFGVFNTISESRSYISRFSR